MRALTMDEVGVVSGGFLEKNQNPDDKYNMERVLVNLGMTPSQSGAVMQGYGTPLLYAGELKKDPATSSATKIATKAVVARVLAAVGVTAIVAGTILSTLIPGPAN
jgi:hypothetical protein